MFNLGMPELLLLAFLGLLLFGSRLPEVGKNLGKGIVEFKKGLSGQDTDATPPQPPQYQQPPQQAYQQPPQQLTQTPSQSVQQPTPTQTNRPA